MSHARLVTVPPSVRQISRPDTPSSAAKYTKALLWTKKLPGRLPVAPGWMSFSRAGSKSAANAQSGVSSKAAAQFREFLTSLSLSDLLPAFYLP